MSKSTYLNKQDIALQWRRTKIIVTLGPATDKLSTIEQLIQAGANVFRLNMSHGTTDEHLQLISRIRRAANRLRQQVAIMVDLCGPKIRVNHFENGSITLEDNELVTITSRQCTGRQGLISSQYRRLHKDVKPGERIFLDDGNLELLVKKIDSNDVICKVIYGGVLKDNKGMNLPDTKLNTSSFTSKDRNDTLLAIENEVDFIALSFVRQAKDINTLKRFLDKHNSDIQVIAKIEKPEAVDNIESILEASYGIMIARGDLGIELPAERIPLMQHELINLAREHDMPVIVATQMLESMQQSPTPTRAEVNDVANAAILSADAVMLSAETAIGQYPLQAVNVMDRILREIEQHQWQTNSFGQFTETKNNSRYRVREAVAHAALTLASDLALQGIIIPTSTGTTARIIAATRPTAPCIGVCPSQRVNQRMMLHWGIIPVLVNEPDTHDWRHLCNIITEQTNLTQAGHTVLLVSGFNDDPALNEPVIKILEV